MLPLVEGEEEGVAPDVSDDVAVVVGVTCKKVEGLKRLARD